MLDELLAREVSVHWGTSIARDAPRSVYSGTGDE